MRDLKPLTDAEITELLGWVSACQSSYHIDSTPGHRFGGLGSHLQENRDSLVEYVNALIAARAQPAQAVPVLSDDIIRMAREAGIDALTKVGADELERFAVLVSKHDFADAYRGAMDELYIWKRRALDAEASSRQLKEKFGAYDHLKMHAVEELCQLGYTVKDGELFPPDHLHKLMEAAQHPLASTQQAEAVPPGFALVPVEPTEAVLRALIDCQDADPEDGPMGEADALYRAMLAAAQGEKP